MKTFLYILKGPDITELFPTLDAQNAYMAAWGSWIKNMMEKRVFVSGLPLMRGGRHITQAGFTDYSPTLTDTCMIGYGFLATENIDEAAALLADSPIKEVDSTVELYEVAGMPANVMQ